MFLVTCHHHSLVDVRSSQKTSRFRKFSSQDPLSRVLQKQLRGRESLVVSTIHAARDEECLKDDDATRITINIYLGPLLILKVAAPMEISALL